MDDDGLSQRTDNNEATELILSARQRSDILTNTGSFYLAYFRLRWFRQFETSARVGGILLTILTIVGFLGRVVFFSPYIHTIFRDDTNVTHNETGRSSKIETNLYAIALFFSLARFVASFLFALLAWLGNRNGVSWRPPMRPRLLILFGFLNYVALILLTYASPPNRTSLSLQPILGTSIVIYTVIFQRICLKTKTSWRRLACTGVVLIGLVVTLVPTFTSFHKTSNEAKCASGSSGDSSRLTESPRDKVIWTLVFLIAFLPRALLVVLARRELKGREGKRVHLAIFMFYINLIILVCVLLSFWISFISGHDSTSVCLGTALRQGLSCSFGHAPMSDVQDYANSACLLPAVYGWTSAVSNNFAAMGSFMLVKHAEDAIYSILVSALATPLGFLVWIFFRLTPQVILSFC